MMTPLEKTLVRQRNLPRHLAELRELIGRDVRGDELLSLDETESIRAQANAIARTPTWHHEMDFSERSSDRFTSLVRSLEQSNERPVYLWTPLSSRCGVLPPVPLSRVNFQFDYSTIPEGILVLLTSDLSDKLLLEFFEDSERLRRMELEGSGPNWGSVAF